MSKRLVRQLPMLGAWFIAAALGLLGGALHKRRSPTSSSSGATTSAVQRQRLQHGVMGYKTPNIDRIAKEGALFTDWYGQQSCTAGRAAFITGQSPIRTGLTKVGLPGAPEGMKKEDPTIATLLKPHGYVTGQFGKNHLGDRDEMLPTAHGFDEFFGNLYHLNAEEEPENPDYPKDPEFKKKFGPRGVIHSAFADGRIRSRHRPADEEADGDHRRGSHGARRSTSWSEAHKDGKPFFIWWNSTRMHIFTHLKTESEGKTGLGIYADGMVEHDGQVGQVLAKLKELGSTRTRSSCTRPTTAPRPSAGPTAAPRCFAARRTRTGKAATACRADPLARRDQARHGHQRHRRARRHAADAARRRGRHDVMED